MNDEIYLKMFSSCDGRLALLLAAGMKLWLDVRLSRRLQNTWKPPSRLCFAELVIPKIFLYWYTNSKSEYRDTTSGINMNEQKLTIFIYLLMKFDK